MAVARPYFSRGIADLEAVFEAARADAAVCRALIDELGHRNTDRSTALRRRVQAALADILGRVSPAATATPIRHIAFGVEGKRTLPPASEEIASSVQHIRPTARPRATPVVANAPAAILSAWTALEALSPQTYRHPADLVGGDRRCVAPFDGEDLPWFRREQSRRNYQLYYQVVLGCIPMDPATDELIKSFGDDEERGRKEREKAALAVVLVDREGVLLDDNAVALSSFGWALPIALAGNLADLGAWTTAEARLVEALTKQLVRTDPEGQPLPLDAKTLRKAFQWLVGALNLPVGLYEGPSFVLRLYHYFRSKNPPEAALLNSFYLGDLMRASQSLERGQVGRALARYLGAEAVSQTPNLLAAHPLIEALVAPSKMPLARWPAPGGHPLVTLQQAAVNAARTRFTKLHADIDSEIRSLESVRQACLKLAPAREAFATARAALDTALRNKGEREEAVAAARTRQQAAEAAAASAVRRERLAFAERPGRLHRLFNTERTRKWRAIHALLATDRAEAERQSTTTTADHQEAIRLLQQADAMERAAQATLTQTEGELQSLRQVIEANRQRLGTRMVDEAFFRQGHEQWNLASPWLSDELQRRREDLFAAAMELHRAFVDVAAQKVSHNLGALMGAMHAGAFREEAKKAVLGDLWSTLFLVCPVVSTTFASVDRMLGDLPAASFGWLLLDEAGQATPQSAVGLLMRAKKAIVVGDPLQIPPVVSLPERLVLEVAKYFGVTAAEWLAPEASTQTLADRASKFKAEFRADVGVREVGIPLLVHRRCQEPMFGISNRIAYDDQMVYAAGHPGPGAVPRALGPSRWINVDATAETKWCPAEGDAVVQLLSQLAAAGVQQPDVYVITPFRIVAHELRLRIGSEPGLLQRLGVDPDDWLRHRVGTIHTFQGKEAEAVIAVLGAPMAAQQGARKWAASTPNIFNVMVSRAKQTLYVVGSRSAWSTVGHGKAVANALGQA